MTDLAPKRVAVTGGSGRLGRFTVAHLLERGWSVRNVDRQAPAEPRAPLVRAELTEYGEAVDALRDVDAVVHLAAVPAPGILTDSATFRHNMLTTHNVFRAAHQNGVRTIVFASSETVLGLPFSSPPDYLPVDEAAPPRPESAYALVKHLEEQMAAQLCRWDPALTMTGLRFSNVIDPVEYASFPAFDGNAWARKWNLWGYIDARDGAEAVRCALERPPGGCEVFIIANADTVMTRPNRELVAEVFPGLHVPDAVAHNETLLAIDRARRMLGFEPRHSWRDAAGS